MDASEYVNDESLELAWAVKAAERARIHMSLLLGCGDTTKLKLVREQPEIYAAFRRTFPDMGVEEVTERELKFENKQIWHDFCEQFQSLDGYNMATLMRIRADRAYNQDNTIIVPKIIYLAVEAARNVEGVNERHKEAFTADHTATGSCID